MVQRSPIQRFPKGTDVTSNLSRRNFLVVGGGGLTAALLAACGGGSSSNTLSTPSASAAGTAKRSGTLRVGSIGGNTDTLDAHFTGSDMDQQRAQNLYDSLKYLA